MYNKKSLCEKCVPMRTSVPNLKEDKIMIKFDLLDACRNCPDLEPIKTDAYNIMHWGEIVDRECTVTCKNIEKCRVLLKHLQKEVENNGN